MLYTVIFRDNELASPDLRQRHMADHLAFLDRHGAEIRSAGPLAAPDGAVFGGLWLVMADSQTRVAELIEADPLRHSGLRADWQIAEWRRVFADGARVT